jgi:hypothetical protein
MFLKNNSAQKELQLCDVQQTALPLFLRPIIQFSGSHSLPGGSQGIRGYISVTASLKDTFFLNYRIMSVKKESGIFSVDDMFTSYDRQTV